jgi:hypothetical protein
VVSTKLLDYCLAGVPVILNRTVAQEEILGSDYPLFVRSMDDLVPVLRAVLSDPDLQRAAALRCRAALAPFRYAAVHAAIGPFLEGRPDVDTALARRPKLHGAGVRIGLPLAATVTSIPPGILEAVGPVMAAAPGAYLVVGRAAAPDAPDPPPGRDPAAALRTGIPATLVERVGTRTITDPWNWWRAFDIMLAPDGVELDSRLAAIGRDSGALVVRTASELADALAGQENSR